MKRNDDGTTEPFVCDRCGTQRIGVVLNILTKTLLPCRCEKKP